MKKWGVNIMLWKGVPSLTGLRALIPLLLRRTRVRLVRY